MSKHIKKDKNSREKVICVCVCVKSTMYKSIEKKTS